MQEKWLTDNFNYEKIVLAGDIGGTNSNLALVGFKNGKFTIINEFISESSEIKNILDPINEIISISADRNESLKPDFCCISAAGPVENNYCTLTNCNWNVDGKEIESKTGFNTFVINDFLAISYGIPTLDVNNAEQVLKIKHTDGSYPEPKIGVKAVIGPGTGLGVSYIIHHNNKYIPCSSEGGHSGFSTFDEDTKRLKDFVAEKIGKNPGVELLVSGQGICNIYDYYKEKKGLDITGVFKDIEAADREYRPALISKNVPKNPVCKEIIQLFIKMFGNFSGSISAIFLPFGGMYLAGGIAAKNQEILLEDNLFMKQFENNYNSNIANLLKQIPVYLIKDYSISLYGSANAAISIMGG